MSEKPITAKEAREMQKQYRERSGSDASNRFNDAIRDSMRSDFDVAIIYHRGPADHAELLQIAKDAEMKVLSDNDDYIIVGWK